MNDTFTLDLQPIGRRVTIRAGETPLAAAQRAGIDLVAHCGGAGTCGRCRIHLISGETSRPTSAEMKAFDPESLTGGWRLACQIRALSDLKVEVPTESLRTEQRLQLEGSLGTVMPRPSLHAVDLTLTPPSMADLRPDSKRLVDALRAEGTADPHASRAFLSDFSTRVRQQGWTGRLVLRGDQAAALLPSDAPLLGLAVDLGTTSLAAYLVDLESGAILASGGAMNPQIAYGEDVVSRIAFCNSQQDGRGTLQSRVVSSITELVERLCAKISTQPNWIAEAVIVGNTVMAHLFAGLPVRQLGEAPYLPAVGGSLSFSSAEVGLPLAHDARVFLPPNIAGYIGSDHVAAILSTALVEKTKPAVMIDIGTNTELSLIHHGIIYATSCASGPAFEGAHISAGMRAAPGAIERIWLEDDHVQAATISDEPPVGICGSGILDAVAVMVDSGMVNKRGILAKEHPLIGELGGERAFLLSEVEGKQIGVIRKDVAEIQLAKSAIRTGIEALLEEAGIQADEVAEWIIAGAFGSYISVESAITIGMFPPLPAGRFKQVGNAAGMGAVRMLISTEERELSERLVPEIRYIELTTRAGFQEAYLRFMSF